MKSKNDTKDLEEYLEAHANELVDDESEDAAEIVSSAKADDKERKARAALFQHRRNELKLSQSKLAKAVGANVRTLQNWEQGRQDFPMSVAILLNLMKNIPSVKKYLTSNSVNVTSEIKIGHRKTGVDHKVRRKAHAPINQKHAPLKSRIHKQSTAKAV